MQHLKRYLPFLLLFSVSQAGSVLGQPNGHWRLIGQLPQINGQNQHVECGYFWDATHGIVASEMWLPLKTTPKIYYVNNGLIQQSQCPVRSGSAKVTSIQMEDDSVGYATLFPDVNTYLSDCLWKTTDGGRSWTEVPNTWGGYFATYRDRSDGLHLLSISRAVPGQGGTSISWMSRDLGFTSDAYVDCYVTSDGGTTWSDLPGTGMGGMCRERFGIFASPVWHSVFLAPERELTSGFGPLQSNDSGKTWSRYALFPSDGFGSWDPTGFVNGGRLAVYVQSTCATTAQSPNRIFQQARGLVRTTDNGRTWRNIGGPSNYLDTRFNILDCNGAEVVAFDSVGGIWLTTDGGDGALKTEQPVLSFESIQKQVNATLCQDTVGTLRFWNEHCRPMELKEITLLDPNSVAVTSGAFRFDSLPGLPRKMKPDDQDLLGFSWKPSGVFSKDTSIGLRVKVRYTSGPFRTEHDTVITIVLNVSAGRVGSSLSTNLIDFGTVSTCTSRDTEVWIRNTGCKPLNVDSTLVTGQGWTLFAPVTSPIEPGDSARVRIHFTPQGSGTRFGSLTIYTQSQGQHGSNTLALAAVSELSPVTVTTTAPASYRFSDRSICGGPDSLLFAIGMMGCDSITVTGYDLVPDENFTLDASRLQGTFREGQTVTARWTLTPTSKGQHTAKLTVHYTLPSGLSQDTTFTVTANILEGTKLLALDRSSIDYGTTTVCEESDSLVTMTNTGCDTLTINAADLGNGFVLLNGVLPIRLAPGESRTLDIGTRADTSSHTTSFAGSLLLTSDAENTVLPVTLTRKIYYPSHLRLEAVDNASAHAGDLVRFRVILEGEVPSSMTALHFDIIHDDDLLAFQKVTGAGLSIDRTTGIVPMTQSYTLQPIIGTGVIGELTFRTYLAKASTTPLTLNNLHFDIPNLRVAPTCVATIDGEGAEFTYLYKCGENLIQGYMQSSRILIETAKVDNGLQYLEVKLNEEVDRLELVNLLGQRVQNITPVSTKAHIGLSNIPAGTYVLQAISRSGPAESREIVIIH